MSHFFGTLDGLVQPTALAHPSRPSALRARSTARPAYPRFGSRSPWRRMKPAASACT
jgi:hypothetical protein